MKANRSDWTACINVGQQVLGFSCPESISMTPTKLRNKENQRPLEQGLTHTEGRSRRKFERRWQCTLFLKNRRHAVGSCPLWTYSRTSGWGVQVNYQVRIIEHEFRSIHEMGSKIGPSWRPRKVLGTTG